MKKHVPYRGAQFSKSRFSVDQGVPRHTARWQMYRAYLQHLRLLPDPWLWSVLQPEFRKRCQYKVPPRAEPPREPDNEGTIEEIEAKYEEWRVALKAYAKVEAERDAQLADTREALNRLRAAVSCHPNALLRLLQQVYGQKLKTRSVILEKLTQTSPSEDQSEDVYELIGEDRIAFPAVLAPLSPPKELPNKAERTRHHTPYHQGRRQALLASMRRWKQVQPPIYIPTNTGVETGWEKTGAVETLRAFAGVGDVVIKGRYFGVGDRMPPMSGRSRFTRPERRTILDGPHQLQTFERLSPMMKRIFPIKLKPTLREPPYPRPPRHETKTEKGLWAQPVPLTNRIIRVAYETIWNRMSWVRPISLNDDSEWRICSYEEMKAFERGEIEGAPPGGGKKKSGGDLSPERPHKWGHATPEEEEWIQAMDVAEADAAAGKSNGSVGVERGFGIKAFRDRARDNDSGSDDETDVGKPWKSERHIENQRLNQERRWLLTKTMALRWLGKWEQFQVNGRVNKREYIDLLSPTPHELDWITAWQQKLYAEGSKYGLRSIRDAAKIEESPRVWRIEKDKVLRDIGNGKCREEYRYVPGLSKMQNWRRDIIETVH